LSYKKEKEFSYVKAAYEMLMECRGEQKIL
jgi:hypothetical protein